VACFTRAARRRIIRSRDRLTVRPENWRADQDAALATSISARTVVDEARRAGVDIRLLEDGRVYVRGITTPRFMRLLQAKSVAIAELLAVEARASAADSLLRLLRDIVAVGGVFREEGGNVTLFVPDPVANTADHVELTERCRDRLQDVYAAIEPRHVYAAFDVPSDVEMDPDWRTAFGWLVLEDAVFTVDERCDVAARTLAAAERLPELPPYEHRLIATFAVARRHLAIDSTVPLTIPTRWEG
jgi:hypothetical protein